MTETVKNSEARAMLDAYIEEQGKRKTPERYAIMDIVLNMEGHHSADEILAMMPRTFHVSRVTVYNTLSILDEVGLVYSHQIHGKTLYENAYGRRTHHHYICKGCHEIKDFENDNVVEAAATCRTPQFRKIRCSVYIYGLCSKCQARVYRLRRKLAKQREANMSREEIRFARISKELDEAAKWFRE